MSERIMLTPENMQEAAKRAAEVLRQGGLLLYPTDTVYGLGADATSAKAVEKVFELKGRPAGKPVHVIVADLEMAAQYVKVTPLAKALAKKFLPGPLTLVLQSERNLPALLYGEEKTLGIRIPDNGFCLALAREFALPYTATSANRSDDPNPRSADEALNSFGPHAKEILRIIDGGVLPEILPSTIVDARTDTPRILRGGAVEPSWLESPYI